MSFILDALRKSETDRQRQSTPGLVDAGYRPPARRRALWLRTAPESGSSSPAIILSSVVLPAPLGRTGRRARGR